MSVVNELSFSVKPVNRSTSDKDLSGKVPTPSGPKPIDTGAPVQISSKLVNSSPSTFKYYIYSEVRLPSGRIHTTSFPVTLTGPAADTAKGYDSKLRTFVKAALTIDGKDVKDIEFNYKQGTALVRGLNDEVLGVVCLGEEEGSDLDEMRKLIVHQSTVQKIHISWLEIDEKSRGALNNSSSLFDKNTVRPKFLPSNKSEALMHPIIHGELSKDKSRIKKKRIDATESVINKIVEKLGSEEKELNEKIKKEVTTGELEKLERKLKGVKKEIEKWKKIDWFAICYSIAYSNKGGKELKEEIKNLKEKVGKLKIGEQSWVSKGISEEEAGKGRIGKLKKTVFGLEAKLSEQEERYLEDIVLLSVTDRKEYIKACCELNLPEKGDALEEVIVRLGLSMQGSNVSSSSDGSSALGTSDNLGIDQGDWTLFGTHPIVVKGSNLSEKQFLKLIDDVGSKVLKFLEENSVDNSAVSAVVCKTTPVNKVDKSIRSRSKSLDSSVEKDGKKIKHNFKNSGDNKSDRSYSIISLSDFGSSETKEDEKKSKGFFANFSSKVDQFWAGLHKKKDETIEKKRVESVDIESIDGEFVVSTGLKNSGNTCFANAPAQLFFRDPQILEEYKQSIKNIF